MIQKHSHTHMQRNMHPDYCYYGLSCCLYWFYQVCFSVSSFVPDTNFFRQQY